MNWLPEVPVGDWRPVSHRSRWLAASEIASPTASGSNPSARAAATASAACSRLPALIVWASLSIQASSGRRLPGVRPTSLCRSSKRGSTLRMLGSDPLSVRRSRSMQ